MREPMTLSAETARERVSHGAARLDSLKPDWHDTVDVLTLRMESCDKCVVGQLYGSYTAILRHELFPELGAAYGFSAYTHDKAIEANNFRLLKDAWIEAIAARKFPDVQIEPADQGAAVPAR